MIKWRYQIENYKMKKKADLYKIVLSINSIDFYISFHINKFITFLISKFKSMFMTFPLFSGAGGFPVYFKVNPPLRPDG
jgi:hypothetical protein